MQETCTKRHQNVYKTEFHVCFEVQYRICLSEIFNSKFLLSRTDLVFEIDRYLRQCNLFFTFLSISVCIYVQTPRKNATSKLNKSCINS